MSADILPFQRPSRKRAKPKMNKSQGMCQHGFHKWRICQEKQFDSRKGKLVTVYKCTRCSAQKVKTH